jgi:hypothetical protein
MQKKYEVGVNFTAVPLGKIAVCLLTKCLHILFNLGFENLNILMYRHFH